MVCFIKTINVIKCVIWMFVGIITCYVAGAHEGGLGGLPGHPAVWDGHPGGALCH